MATHTDLSQKRNIPVNVFSSDYREEVLSFMGNLERFLNEIRMKGDPLASTLQNDIGVPYELLFHLGN